MNEKKKMPMAVKVMIGLLSGIVAGILTQGVSDIIVAYVKPVGTLYMNAVKMLIVPLVFCSLVMGATGMGDLKKFGRVGAKTMGFYMVTTFFAAVIGLTLANITKIGMNLNLNLAEATAIEIPESPNIIDTIVNIVPTNPIAAMANGNMLQVIVFAVLIGFGIVTAGEKAEPVMRFFEGFTEVMYKVTGFIMGFTPYAVFALMTSTIATNGPKVLLPLITFVLICYAGFLIHLVCVYFTMLKTAAGISPLKFLKTVQEAAVVAFSTCSSSAALPVTLECGKKLGISQSIRSFALPLGSAINIDGGAIYQSITAIFIANLFGIPLSLNQQLVIVMTVVLASIGTAGVAGSSMIMLGAVLTSVGLPIEGIALVTGVDRIVDMPRTAMNVLGDLTCSAVVAKTEGELDVAGTMREEIV